jgi:hypothetical protein
MEINKVDKEIQVDENELNQQDNYKTIILDKYNKIKLSLEENLPSKIVFACDYVSNKYSQLKSFFGSK